MNRTSLPLIYSCSGCSSAAQTANAVALRLDRDGIGEMSCIAGLGADLPIFIKEAKSGRQIVALDGCPLACVRNCLARHGIDPDHHFEFSNYGVKRHKHEDFDARKAEELEAIVQREICNNPKNFKEEVSA